MIKLKGLILINMLSVTERIITYMKISNNFDTIYKYPYLLLCLLMPWTVVGMQIAFGLLISLFLFKLIFDAKTKINFHPFYYCILLYLIANIITLLLNHDSYASLKSFIKNDWIVLFIPFLISIPISASIRKRGFEILLISAAVVGIYGMMQYFVGIEFFRNKTLAHEGNFFRSVGGYSFYLTYAGNQLFAFCMALSFFFLSKNKRMKKVIFIILVIIFLSILASFARSIWLALILVFFLACIIVFKRNSVYVIGVSAIVVILIFLFFPDLQARFMSIFDPARNETRINLWKTSWRIFSANPLIGVGQAQFKRFFKIYQVPGFYDSKAHAHNDYLHIMVVNGLLGILSWLGMWIAWFYYALRSYWKNKLEESDRKIILGSILGIAGILVAALFQCYYRDLENNIFWWFLTATTIQIIIGAKSADY
jgi:O-antigen ligase